MMIGYSPLPREVKRTRATEVLASTRVHERAASACEAAERLGILCTGSLLKHESGKQPGAKKNTRPYGQRRGYVHGNPEIASRRIPAYTTSPCSAFRLRLALRFGQHVPTIGIVPGPASAHLAHARACKQREGERGAAGLRWSRAGPVK